MQTMSLSKRAAFEQHSAQLQQLWRRISVVLNRVSLERWQWLITLLLVIWLSHSLARLFWLVMPVPVIPPAAVTVIASNAPTGSAATAGAVNIEQLKTLTPFGDAPIATVTNETQPVAATIENEASDTQLNLILRGVLASNDEKAARAVISSGEKQEVFAIGDILPAGNNVKLVKVLDGRVILDNNGKYESLWLFKEDPNAPKIASPYNAAQIATPANSDWPQAGGSTGPYPPPGNDPPPAVASDPALAQATKTLADVVAMSIYRENGQVIGYKIRPGRNAEQFTALGLQTDDIVIAVNGVPLSSPGKIMEIYKNMSSATSANLEIKRGGSVVNLDIVLK